MSTTVTMLQEPHQAFFLVEAYPAIDGVWITHLQQSVLGHPMRRMALSDLEKRCRAFSYGCTGMVMQRFL
jgi:hypothetical protein